MDIASLMAMIVLVATIGTMVVGFGAYVALKLHEKRKPKAKRTGDTLNEAVWQEPIFLKRYVPAPAADSASDA